MSEQIKPVDRYFVTKDGYLIPMKDGNVIYYGDHAETVQQLQRRCESLLDEIDGLEKQLAKRDNPAWIARDDIIAEAEKQA